MKNKAFTLVEIMVVIIIIGLLAAMAIPAFQKVRAQAEQKKHRYENVSTDYYVAPTTPVIKEVIIDGKKYRLVEGQY